MPIRPNPVLFRCPQCGWSTVWHPSSDFLDSLPPSACPRCGNRNLEHQPPSPIDFLRHQLGSLFGKKSHKR